MEPIQIIGMDELKEDIEKQTVNKISNEYYEKIQRALDNITSIQIHVKAHSKGGKSTNWEIKVKVVAPTKVFESQESDWDLARTLHKVFNKIERQIEHRFRD